MQRVHERFAPKVIDGASWRVLTHAGSSSAHLAAHARVVAGWLPKTTLGIWPSASTQKPAWEFKSPSAKSWHSGLWVGGASLCVRVHSWRAPSGDEFEPVSPFDSSRHCQHCQYLTVLTVLTGRFLSYFYYFPTKSRFLGGQLTGPKNELETLVSPRHVRFHRRLALLSKTGPEFVPY